MTALRTEAVRRAEALLGALPLRILCIALPAAAGFFLAAWVGASMGALLGALLAEMLRRRGEAERLRAYLAAPPADGSPPPWPEPFPGMIALVGLAAAFPFLRLSRPVEAAPSPSRGEGPGDELNREARESVGRLLAFLAERGLLERAAPEFHQTIVDAALKGAADADPAALLRAAAGRGGWEICVSALLRIQAASGPERAAAGLLPLRGWLEGAGCGDGEMRRALAAAEPEAAAAWRTLDLEPGAGPAEVKAAWKRLSKRTHPDAAKGGSEAFLELRKAYELLSSREGGSGGD